MSKDDAWYLRDLLAFMLGIERDAVADLARNYLEQGGAKDPRSFFRYLSSQGRRYGVLWVLFPFSDPITVVAVTVFGPGDRPLWHEAMALPYGQGSATLSSWKRLLSLTGGVAPASQPKVPESDFWVADRMARQFRVAWSERALDILREVKAAKGEEEPSFQGDRDFLRTLAIDPERLIREATGKGLSAAALFYSEMSLPELREEGGQNVSLLAALDAFVEEVIGRTEVTEQVPLETAGRQGLQEYRLRVDPVLGVPLSDLSPGTPVLLEGVSSPLVGKVYMVRLLKDGQIEVHGALDEEAGSFFRSVAPGDIKVAVAKALPWTSFPQLPLLLLAGGLFAVLLLLLFWLR